MWNRNLTNNSVISALWIFYMLNLFARDIHELGRPGMLEQVMSGTIDGVKVTELLMLMGGLMAAMPIAMALASLVMSRNISRGLNLVFAPLTIAMTVMTNLEPDLDNLFFAGLQIAAMLVAVRIAWYWKDERSAVLGAAF